MQILVQVIRGIQNDEDFGSRHSVIEYVAFIKRNTGRKGVFPIISRETQGESNQYFPEIVRKIMSLVTKQILI